jgi:hypothetical protein
MADTGGVARDLRVALLPQRLAAAAMSPRPRRTEEPTDRLTRLCKAMTEAFDAHPEHREGDKAIVFLDDGDHGGIQIHGYDDDTDAIVDLFVHLRALFRAQGKDLSFMPIPPNPQDQ